jgi:NAD(P) transhydrogenase subunit beta
MTANEVALSYLAASVLFILALRGLSHPRTARRGNLLGMVGMALAIATTFAITNRIDMARLGIGIGAVVGLIVSRRVQMTQMPELVAAMHSLVGLAAVLIAFAVVNDPSAFTLDVPIPRGNRLELFVGTSIVQSPFRDPSSRSASSRALANTAGSFRAPPSSSRDSTSSTC